MALITSLLAPKIKRWSGISYFVERELTRRFGDVTVIGAHRLEWALRFPAKALRVVGIEVEREALTAELFSHWIEPQLQSINPDVVLATAASTMIACLPRRWPLVHFSDSTFASMLNYFPNFRHLSRRTIHQGEALEARVLERADACVFASHWAAESALAEYDVDPRKVHVVPFGANLMEDPVPVLDKPRDGRLRLLLLGVDWERKGGPLALAIVRALRMRGIAVDFAVAGCAPPAEVTDVVRLGSFNKTDPADYARFSEAMGQADFLLVPSAQEAFGIVYAEASSFGTPSIARETGGVSDAVREGVNGLLIRDGETPDMAADRILALWSDPDRYAALRRSSRALYEQRLNWRAWGNDIERIFHGLVGWAEPQRADRLEARP